MESRKILVNIWDKPREIYHHMEYGLGLNLDTNKQLNESLSQSLTRILQIFKMQDPKSKIDINPNNYKFYSWSMENLSPKLKFMSIPDPGIIMVVQTDKKSVIEEAYQVKKHLENMPASKKLIAEWMQGDNSKFIHLLPRNSSIRSFKKVSKRVAIDVMIGVIAGLVTWYLITHPFWINIYL